MRSITNVYFVGIRFSKLYLSFKKIPNNHSELFHQYRNDRRQLNQWTNNGKKALKKNEWIIESLNRKKKKREVQISLHTSLPIPIELFNKVVLELFYQTEIFNSSVLDASGGLCLDWLIRYHTALSNTGLVALSTPYIDAFGAGVVITAAHTIYRGEAQNIHSADDGVVAVMGADFPLSYFHK